MFKLAASLLLTLTALSAFAQSETPVTFLNASGSQEFAADLRKTFSTSDTRLIRAEKNSKGWAVRIFSKTYHRFESAQINERHELAIYDAQPVITTPHCPDPSVQFIGFAPNDNDYELKITQGVVNEAKKQGYKTVLLAKKAATGQAFLDYLSCPKVIGDFYDGDANPTEIVTADGTLTHQDFAANVNFNYHVTHIWLACEAYNNPMLKTMIETTRSQKYAAGKNDLIIGPSDETAACATKAALHGAAMKAAFDKCYAALDDKADQWGFGGGGTDFLGQ